MREAAFPAQEAQGLLDEVTDGTRGVGIGPARVQGAQNDLLQAVDVDEIEAQGAPARGVDRALA
jgi:hypothetical protein